MAQSIKNRIFGSDIPVMIKKKIEARQLLASKTHDPGEQIKPSQYLDDRPDYYTFGELNETNFDGQADLSSRTPFVRMWTSLDMATDIKIEGDNLNQEDATKWEDDKNKQININNADYKDHFLKKQGDNYEKHKWEKVGAFKRIYELGNHVLNTLERDPNAQISNDVTYKSNNEDKTLNSNIIKAILPHEQESDSNQFLKPPAGITSLSSETEGALGTIKKTTVNFIVHNFSDFENIYLRYFLKPGAQIFIDFGWDTGFLYDIEKLLDSDDIEDNLFGENGYITLSKGDMETVYGHVINYDAKVREDGGFDCSVEVVSKNAALLSNTFDEKLKERVKFGLDIETMAVAVSDVLDDPLIYKKALSWGDDSTTEEELRETLESATAKLLGGTSSKLPGECVDTDCNSSLTSVLSSQYGVFYAGSVEDNMRLFVNFGWFEDLFLNKEFGFSDDESSLTNKSAAEIKKDEQSLKAKFNSKNSFITYSDELKNAMKQRGVYTGAAFLYPETWGDKWPTYNTENGMVPDSYEEYLQPGEAYMSDNPSAADKQNGRLPLREIFIAIDMIKESMDLATTSGEFLKNIMGRIDEASGGIIELGLKSNSYGQHSMAFFDKNVLKEDANEPKKSSDLPEFLKKLLVFKPYTQSTIVKGYDLSFSMPEGGLGNMIAVQSSQTLASEQSISSMLDGLVKFELLNRNQHTTEVDYNEVFVRYNPSIGDMAGKRFVDIHSKENFGVYNLSKDSVMFAGLSNDSSPTQLKLDNSSISWGEDVKDVDGYIEALKSQLDNAVNPLENLEGKSYPKKKKKEESTEDTKKSEEQLARSRGNVLVSSPYEWYIKNAVNGVRNRVTPLIPIEATLKIYGISSLVPGDLMRINYLPKNYLNNVYFQITKVSHNVGSTWDTTLTSQMRIMSLLEPEKTTGVRIRKSYLRNVLKLKEIDDFIHLFGNLKPMTVDTKLQYIDHIFKCETVLPKGDSIEEFQLKDIPTEVDEVKYLRKLKGLFAKGADESAAKKGKEWNNGKDDLTVKFRWDDYVDSIPLSDLPGGYLDDFQFRETTSGAECIVSGLHSDSTGNPINFQILTSGPLWVIIPSGMKREYFLHSKINRMFQMSNSKLVTKDLLKSKK